MPYLIAEICTLLRPHFLTLSCEMISFDRTVAKPLVLNHCSESRMRLLSTFLRLSPVSIKTLIFFVTDFVPQ